MVFSRYFSPFRTAVTILTKSFVGISSLPAIIAGSRCVSKCIRSALRMLSSQTFVQLLDFIEILLAEPFRCLGLAQCSLLQEAGVFQPHGFGRFGQGLRIVPIHKKGVIGGDAACGSAHA